MGLRRNVLRESDIYAILDSVVYQKEKPVLYLNEFLKNKVSVIQLRDKLSSFDKILEKALYIKKVIAGKAIFIVNDYPEICLLSGADGLHLGQDDLPVKTARKILGKNRLIGISCHSLREALVAQDEGADYIGFGPIYPTPTKKNYKAIGVKELGQVKKRIKIPFFIIGSIDIARLEILKPYEIERVAVCRALADVKNITSKVRDLRKLLVTNC